MLFVQEPSLPGNQELIARAVPHLTSRGPRILAAARRFAAQRINRLAEMRPEDATMLACDA